MPATIPFFKLQSDMKSSKKQGMPFSKRFSCYHFLEKSIIKVKQEFT